MSSMKSGLSTFMDGHPDGQDGDEITITVWTISFTIVAVALATAFQRYMNTGQARAKGTWLDVDGEQGTLLHEDVADDYSDADEAEAEEEAEERPAAAALARDRQAATSKLRDRATSGDSARGNEQVQLWSLPLMPGSPQSPSRAAQFMALPNELLLDVGRHVLSVDLPAALSLRQTCRRLCTSLDLMRAEAETWRLRWEADATTGHAISNDGRTLTSMCGPDHPWAAGTVLPTAGHSCWKIHVDTANGEDGGIFVGICDGAGLNAWGVELNEGTLFRVSRNDSGRPVIRVPPPGWPNGHGMPVVRNARGSPRRLQKPLAGVIVEVHVDHLSGVLRFRINGGPLVDALRGFPRGAELRPWVSLYLSVDDRVTLLPLRPFY